jgi:hypothetical protein
VSGMTDKILQRNGAYGWAGYLPVLPDSNVCTISVFKTTVASGADPGTASSELSELHIACGSVTNASSCGDSYEGAFCACVWQFCGVYAFFRKAYCFKNFAPVFFTGRLFVMSRRCCYLHNAANSDAFTELPAPS